MVERSGMRLMLLSTHSRFPLVAVVFLHHDGTQEGCYEDDGEHARDGIGVPVESPAWQQVAH